MTSCQFGGWKQVLTAHFAYFQTTTNKNIFEKLELNNTFDVLFTVRCK